MKKKATLMALLSLIMALCLVLPVVANEYVVAEGITKDYVFEFEFDFSELLPDVASSGYVGIQPSNIHIRSGSTTVFMSGGNIWITLSYTLVYNRQTMTIMSASGTLSDFNWNNNVYMGLSGPRVSSASVSGRNVTFSIVTDARLSNHGPWVHRTGTAQRSI